MQMLIVTRNGDNFKLGKCATTYRPVGPTCPQDCALLGKGGGCYAKRGFVAIHQRNALNSYHELDKANGVPLIRHHISGDVFLRDKLDTIYVDYILDWHKANPKTEGWMYTHRFQDWHKAGYSHLTAGLTVLASVDTKKDKKAAKKAGWKYAYVTKDSNYKLEKDEIFCPFDAQKDAGKAMKDVKVKCKTCRLCFDSKVADKNIVFKYQKAKGNKKKGKVASLKVA